MPQVIRAVEIGEGDAQSLYNATTGQLLAVKSGTSAAPDTVLGPLVKVERTMGHTEAALSGDGVEQMAALLAVAVGTVVAEGQPVGVAGMAKTSSTAAGGTAGGNDACGLYGVGSVTGSGTGVGIGGFFSGRRGTTGRVTGIEVSVYNGGAAGAWSSTAYPGTVGLWCNANGAADSGAGITIGNPWGRQFKVGLGFNAQVNNSLTGGVADASIRDDSSSTTSLDVRGSHTYGLDLASGAFSGAAIHLANDAANGSIKARNAANNGDLNLMYLNAGNSLVLGANVASVFVSQNLTMADAKHITFNATTGSKIGIATTQKLGFWNATPVVQPTAVADATDAASVITQVNALLAKLRTIGLIAA